MNYAQLQQAIIDDTHKLQYTGADVQRYIAQGEALIGAHLEAYNFLGTLADANRVTPQNSSYVLPSKLSQLRYVRLNGRPLDKVDETMADLYQSASNPIMYVQRARQIKVAGNPGDGVVLDIDYMGMPEALSITPTNTLLDEYPQLYIDATSHYVFKRAEDYESAELALQATLALCRQINRKVKKLLGGAQGAPAYNVNFRSSY